MSKSRTLAYLNCPFNFKCVYIDKFPRESSPALEKGSCVHEVIDWAYTQTMPDGRYPTIDEFENLVKNHESYKKYQKPFDNFLAFCRKLGDNYRPILWEDTIELENMIGIIDVVFEDSNSLLIMDFKTGKMKDVMTHFKFELAMYCYLYEKKYNKTPTHIAILFLDQSPDPVIIKYDKAWAKESIDEVNRVRELIQNEFFPTIQGLHCRWCVMKKYCPIYKS